MNHLPRVRALAAAAAIAAALAVATPATVASAQPCSRDTGCRTGQPRNPEYRMGWILRVDADGTGSYWTYDLYYQDRQGHCFGFGGEGVGCPD